MSTQTDLVDDLLGITPGSPLDAVRRARPQQREHTQVAHEALLHPVTPSEEHVPVPVRDAVAVFVAALHGSPRLVERYQQRLEPGLRDAVLAIAARTAVPGPYGAYDADALDGESVPGPRVRLEPAETARVGGPLAAALEHAHLLVLRPREASAQDLRRLLDAGWSTTAVVTISQLVAFLAYQARLVHGLDVLSATGAGA